MSARTTGAVALSAVAVVAVAGVAVAAAGYVQHSPTPLATAAPSASSAELQRHADEVFEQFNGTPEQRDASSLLQAWSLNGAMDVCMAAEGFPEWDWSALHNSAPRTNALDPSLFFAPPLNHSYSNSVRDSTAFLLAEEALRTTRLSKAESEAADRCADSTPSTSDSDASAASTPEVVAKLRDEWWSMLAGWERYGNVGDYNTCFATAADGLPIRVTDGDSWKGGLPGLRPRPAEIPPTSAGDVRGSADWQGFVKVEGALEAVDWACRGVTYEAHVDDVSGEIDSFAEDHAAEIEEAVSAWDDVQRRAAVLPAP
jgi:hypothetical protein